MLQVIHLLQLLNLLLILDLLIVLTPVFAAEENNGVFPGVANPALTALGSDPLGLRIDLEVRVLRVRDVKDELRVAKLTSDNKRLGAGSVATQSALHTALNILLVLLQLKR